MSRLLLPLSIVTKDGPVLMPDKAAVEQNFQHYLTAIDRMSIDLVDRSVVSLENCQDGTWLGTFQSRLVSKGTLATAPYTSTALLQFRDYKFRMSSMLNGRGHSEWTGFIGA